MGFSEDSVFKMGRIRGATTGSLLTKKQFPACHFLDRGPVMAETETEPTQVQANRAILKKKTNQQQNRTVVTPTELNLQKRVSTESLSHF